MNGGWATRDRQEHLQRLLLLVSARVRAVGVSGLPGLRQRGDLPLEPLDSFLQQTSLAELRELLERWNAATEFLESYKRAKRERIEAVIAMKEKGVA